MAGFVLAAACSDVPRQQAVPSEVAKACADDAAITCAKYDACEGGFATITYGSPAACMDRNTRGCEQGFLSPGVSQDLQPLATCAANQQAQTCDEWVGKLTPGCGVAGLESVLRALLVRNAPACGTAQPQVVIGHLIAATRLDRFEKEAVAKLSSKSMAAVDALLRTVLHL